MNQSSKPKNGSKQALLSFMRKVYFEKFHEDCPLILTKEYLEQFLATAKHFVGDSCRYQYERTAALYLQFLKAEGREGCLLEDNTKPVIKRFGAYLVTECAHNVQSANARLEKLDAIFAEAKAEQMIEINPVFRIRLKDRAAETEEDIDIHQPYSKAHIYAAIDRGLSPGLNPEMAVAHLLSCDFGARGGDVFALDRSMWHQHSEVKKNFLKYYARKPKKWHKVYPFAETVLFMQEYLDYHLLDTSEMALLFPTFGQHTGPSVADSSFNRGSSSALTYFGCYLDALGIRVLLQTESECRASYSHASHSGRVTAITMAAQDGIAESITRKRVVHSGDEVHRIYQKHTPEAVQRAMTGAHNDEGSVNITTKEFRAAMVHATERLRSLRGQLDLHKEGVKHNKTHRASLKLPSSQPGDAKPAE